MGVGGYLKSFLSFFQYWYLQWELNTSLYMLEPAEKAIVHSITLAILGVIVYAALTYLPGHMIMMMHFLYGALTEGETT